MQQAVCAMGTTPAWLSAVAAISVQLVLVQNERDKIFGQILLSSHAKHVFKPQWWEWRLTTGKATVYSDCFCNRN